MSWLGLCGADVLPPLKPVDKAERLLLRDKLAVLSFPVCNPHPDEDKTRDWTDDGRPGGSRAGALRSSPFQP